MPGANLPRSEPAAIERIPFPGGDLACAISGGGRPILLVHSINAAASRCEMAALADALSPERRVYNLDLPGFGGSERPAVRYDIRRFVAAIDAAVAWIRVREGEAPLDAVALSLSCEFLARSAAADPGRYARLALISPTGFQSGAHRLVEAPGETFEQRWLSPALESAAGRLLYAGLTRPASIRFFLRRTFGSDRIDPLVYDCAVRTARAPGAAHAPLAFLTGRLFGRDITRVYQSLRHPVFLAHGLRGAFADFGGVAWAEARSNWTIKAYDTGAMPHVETPDVFAADLRRHWAEPAPSLEGPEPDGAPAVTSSRTASSEA